MAENNQGRPADSADDRARRIAEAKARAEAARQARTGGGPPLTPETPVEAAAPASPPEAQAVPAAASTAPAGEDDRARRIAEARARAEAAKAARAGGDAPPAPAAAPPPAAPAPAAAQAAPAGAAAQAAPAAAEGGDDRAARIAAARARALAAREGGGGAAAAPAPAQRTPEEEAARQARLEEARARAGSGAAAAPAAAAPASAPATAPAARAAAAVPAARALPASASEWRAPAGSAPRIVTARPDPVALAERELSRQEVANLVTRRSMVRTSLWASLGVMLAGFALGFVNFFWPRKVTGFGATFTMPAPLIPQPGGEPVKFFEARAWVVNLQPGEGVPPQFQSVAPASENGGILALYQKCPHLGCTVPWKADFDFEGVKGWYRCPCHGSTYSKAGIRVYGPALRPMDTFEVTAAGGGAIAINTSKITKGDIDNANRAITL